MMRWFGVVYMVNMQMSFLSPPYGYALLYVKSVALPEIGMGAILPLSLAVPATSGVGVVICIIFHELILWLPAQVCSN
jgi:TRAP-type mannitol/chloroaromatic compound transport system permease large subunit